MFPLKPLCEAGQRRLANALVQTYNQRLIIARVFHSGVKESLNE